MQQNAVLDIFFFFFLTIANLSKIKIKKRNNI